MNIFRRLVLILSLAIGPVAVARAQATPLDASDRDRAHRLFDEATQAAKRGDFRQARSSLSAAWALVKNWDIAANLGATELKLGSNRDAAEHLAWAVREGSIKVGETDEVVIRSRALLAQAAMLVGTVKLRVDQPAVAVLLDGRFVGNSPLADPIYIEPGAHVISARPGDASSRPVELRIQIAAGEMQDSFLRVRPTESVAGSPSVSSVPVGTPNDAGIKPKTVVLLVESGLTAVGAGVAVVYTMKASAARSDADDLKVGPGPASCNDLSERCRQLADANDRRDRFAGVADVAWITTAVLAAGTLGTFVLWPNHSAEKGSSPARALVRLGPRYIGLHGSF